MSHPQLMELVVSNNESIILQTNQLIQYNTIHTTLFSEPI
jgi:hypothetical protein